MSSRLRALHRLPPSSSQHDANASAPSAPPPPPPSDAAPADAAHSDPAGGAAPAALTLKDRRLDGYARPPPLSERDSIFAETYHQDEGALTSTVAINADDEAAPGDGLKRDAEAASATSAGTIAPAKVDAHSKHQFNGMASSTVTTTQRPATGSRKPTAPAPQESFDLYLYGTRKLAAVDNKSTLSGEPSVRPAYSENLPDHLIALPPLSSPLQSPRRPSTPHLASGIDGDDEERLRYRSWREGRPVLGGRVMAVDGDEKRSAVDKKIEATLPRAEQTTVRTRKTSHILGIFKQNDATHETRLQPTVAEEGPELIDPWHAGVRKRLTKDSSEPAQVDISQDPRRWTDSPEVSPDRTSPHSDDGEDGHKEHIRYATFISHQPLDKQAARSQSHDERVPRKDEDESPEKSSASRSRSRPYPDHGIELSLKQGDETQLLHGEFPILTRTRSKDHDELSSQASHTSASETEFDPSDTEPPSDSSEHPGGTVTPKAERRPSVRQPQAIELNPFSHQVGGHTALYRISRHAVCKKLNNRENKFYETVEQYHPELMDFMPRYIGVLNVTFEKGKRRKTVTRFGEELSQANGSKNATEDNEKTPEARIFSHSHQQTSHPIVYPEMNRHIIPSSLFRRGSRSVSTLKPFLDQSPHADLHDLSSSFSASQPSSPRFGAQGKSSWGATIVNSDLKDRVIQELFAPTKVNHRTRKRRVNRLSRYDSVPAVVEHHAGNPKGASSVPTRIIKPREPAGLSQSMTPPGISTKQSLVKMVTQAEAAKQAGEDNAPRRIPRRRASTAGLQRHHSSVENRHGDLEFFDDDDYRGDDEVFAMESDGESNDKRKEPANELAVDKDSNQEMTPRQQPKATFDDDRKGLLPPLEISQPAYDYPPVPCNPKEARMQADQRSEEFILLEDLTAGLSHPCTLDLKMGTRQHGIDADDKKQKSQRAKCKTTTSRALGVRVCGMQTYDVKKADYVWQDKYYGRDLRAGREFQDALTAFFHNGVNHDAARRFIPMFLDKISELERLIRGLPGYRFYGSSLYIIYDGDAAKAKPQKPRSSSDGTDAGPPAPQDPVFIFKIIDFANCVTAEAADGAGVCPPANPAGIDRGYLRGLRTLRMYFRRIWAEVSREGPDSHGGGLDVTLAPEEHALQDDATVGAGDEGDEGDVST